MAFPAFFDEVPPLTLRDPLAEILGAAAGGLIEYRFGERTASVTFEPGADGVTVRALGLESETRRCAAGTGLSPQTIR